MAPVRLAGSATLARPDVAHGAIASGINGGERMQHVHDGQCGLCVHFGEAHLQDNQLLEIRRRHEAPETMVDDCGHPRHASLHLRVTPISGCDGFEPARG